MVKYFMATNYDSIASVYDLLSRIVYGKAIINAQVSLLKFIPPGSRILIVGGGTGWILEKLAEQQNSGLSIDYVESSTRMIALSEKRNYGLNAVNFINLPVESFEGKSLYDVVFTPFFFDNFKQDKIEPIFNGLNRLLKNNGVWLYADFVHNDNESRLWQKLLLKTMYFFFHVTCNIETNELVNMEGYFHATHNKIYECSFYSGFIKATAWKRGKI